NIFVFVIVFSELHVPAEHQRRVLAWGIAGALVFRALMITAGIALVERFHWITYPFAALILLAAWRMLFAEERERRGVEHARDVCSACVFSVCHGGCSPRKSVNDASSSRPVMSARLGLRA